MSLSLDYVLEDIIFCELVVVVHFNRTDIMF